MPSQKEPNSEEEDDAEGDPMDTIPADLDYAAFLSSDEDEIDIGSEKKVARVRRLMEQPVDDSAASKRATAGEIRALLKEAHVQSQRMNMQKFLEDCKRRLESDDSLGEPAAGRRCCLVLPRSACVRRDLSRSLASVLCSRTYS